MGNAKTFDRAEPGEFEEPTMLYPLWKTPLIDMGDFGIGIGLYFYTLKFFAIIAFIAGLINIPALIYVNSPHYNPGLERNRNSPICTNFEWQPCPTCKQSDWERFPTRSDDRFAQTSDGSLTFIKVNGCKIDDIFGISTYASLVFIIVAVYSVNYLLKRKAIKLDEAEQTAKDYSIQINNPPPNAKDPESWKEFFESNFDAEVKFCTIAIDNKNLIQTVIDRRRLILTLQNMLSLGETFNIDDIDVEARLALPLWKKLICCKSPGQILATIREKENEIIEMARDPKFNVVSVFVVFNTEKAQRNVLQTLSAPRFMEAKIKEEHKYEGNILKVIEPDEPESIRWTDLEDPLIEQFKKKFFTLMLSIIIIAAGGLLIVCAEMKDASFLVTSIIIVTQSIITPPIVRYLTSFESHYTESSRLNSEYLKITAFRWIITVIFPLALSPFANILNKDTLVRQIQVLLFADLIQRPIIQVLGLAGFIKRHILGPRAKTQRKMNLMFSGDFFNIGERFTDVTKIFLLTVFYCVLNPISFFLASAVFSVFYWIDKFSILRSWQQGPRIGAGVSSSSGFFFQLCVLAYAVQAVYFYSHFPYDNACPSDDEDISAYTGSVNVTLLNGAQETIHDMVQKSAYKFCSQETIRRGKFPPFSKHQAGSGGLWMDTTQEKWVDIFSWTLVVVLILTFASTIKFVVDSYVQPSYDPNERVINEQKFEDVKEINAYIPQIKLRGFTFPFLMCDIQGINENNVGWRDPYEGYEIHNLVDDVSSILARQDIQLEGNIFSHVKEWSAKKLSLLPTVSTNSSGIESSGTA